MRLDKWFISNLDDLQRQIIVRDPNENLIVQGSAGSGKTNLAIHRAVQASAYSDSYAIVVYTIALKRMVAYGLESLNLDKERIAYDWGWENRGFDFIGDVYCRGNIEMKNGHPIYYLVDNDNVYKLTASTEGSHSIKSNGMTSQFRKEESHSISSSEIRESSTYSPCNDVEIFSSDGFEENGNIFLHIEISNQKLFLVQNGTIREFVNIPPHTTISEENFLNDLQVSIDFSDWVESAFYRCFGRRKNWFREIELEENINISDTEMVLIPSGTLFRKAEEKLDYLIIDEAQDFNIEDYQNRFLPKVNKSISLFGDSSQKIYSNRGASMDDITEALRFRRLFLKYNYRLPKSIARVAQDIVLPSIDLISDNMKDSGNSDYPQYPKPIIQKHESRDEELAAIIAKIELEDLDDIAILVPTEEDVKYVHNFFSQHGIQTQVLYRTGKYPPYRTVNTLDFTNNDLPCILTYHAAKGTEFDNVFVPFADARNLPDRNAFYVACTRASHSLTISFSSKTPTEYLNNINPSHVVVKNIPENTWENNCKNK